MVAAVTADPKPAPRVRDVDALRLARIRSDECAACRSAPSNVHHVILRGEGGDDVAGNLLLLCGSGTMGCHGAWHGNPYLVRRRGEVERRDAEWVRRRVGETIRSSRPDVVEYVRSKLGAEAGDEYLRRAYRMEEGS